MTTETAPSEQTTGRWHFAHASIRGHAKYVTAHPTSDMGDPNYADQIGYEFVSYQSEGLLVYRRKDQNGSATLLDLFTNIIGLCGLTGISCLMLMWNPESLNTFKIGIVLAVITVMYFIMTVTTWARRKP